MLLLPWRLVLSSQSFVLLFSFCSLCTCANIWRADQLAPLGNVSRGPSCPASNDFESAALLTDYLTMNLARFKTERRALDTSCAYAIVEQSLSAPSTTAHLDTVIAFGLSHASRFSDVFDLVSSGLTYPVYSSLKSASVKLNAFLTCPETFCSSLTLDDLFELDTMYTDSADAQARMASSIALFKSKNCLTCTNKLTIGNLVSSVHHRPHQFITTGLPLSDFLTAYLPYYPILLPEAFHALSSIEFKKEAFLEPSKIAKETYANMTLDGLCPLFMALKRSDMERLAKVPVLRSNTSYAASEFNKCVPTELLHDLAATRVVEEFKEKNVHFFTGAKEELLLARLHRTYPPLFQSSASDEEIKASMGTIDDAHVIRFLCAERPQLALFMLASMTTEALLKAELSDAFFDMTASQCASLSLSVFTGHDVFGSAFLARNAKNFDSTSMSSSCAYELLRNSLAASNSWQQHASILTALMDEKTEPLPIKMVFSVISPVVRREIISSKYDIMKRRLFLDALDLDTQKGLLYAELELDALHDILSGSFTSSEAGVRGLFHFVQRLASADIAVGAQVHDLAKRPTSVNLFKMVDGVGDGVNAFFLKKALLVMLNVSAPISVEEFQSQPPLAKKEIFLLGQHYLSDIYTHMRPVDFQELVNEEEISESDLEALNRLLVDLRASSILFGSALKYGEHLTSGGLAHYSDCSTLTTEQCERSKEFLLLVSKNIPAAKKGILGGLF